LSLLGPHNYSIVEGGELALVCSASPHLNPIWRKKVRMYVNPNSGSHNYSIVEGGELALVCSASPHINPIWRKKVKGSMLTLIVGPSTTALWREESWPWSALLPLISTPSGRKR
jgi:hypothetical protein